MTKFDMFYDVYNPNELMNYTSTQPLNDRFFEMGLESTSFFDNLGSMTVLWVFNFFYQLLPPLIILVIRLLRLQDNKVITRFMKFDIF